MWQFWWQKAQPFSWFFFGREFNKTKDPFAARDFQNKWSQIADVNAIRLYDAMKNNDKDGIKEIVNAVGGPDSIGYKNLLNKIKFMGTLVKGQ